VHPRAPDLVSAEPLDDDVHREPVQPGRERRIPAKRAELLPEAHEDVLGQLVGVAAGRHPAHQSMHPRQVRAVELLEGADVSRRGPRHVGWPLSGRKRVGRGTQR
jgi:hypothetical protein